MKAAITINTNILWLFAVGCFIMFPAVLLLSSLTPAVDIVTADSKFSKTQSSS